MPNGLQTKQTREERVSRVLDIAKGKKSKSSILSRGRRASTTSKILSVFEDKYSHRKDFKSEEIKIPFGRFDPFGAAKQFWDFALMMFIFWSVLTVPYSGWSDITT